MANTKDKVLAVALGEVGYLEKSAAAVKSDPTVLYNKTTGAGNENYTKYGKEMHELYPKVMDYPAAWCDCFVDWCFMQAYGIANAKGLLGGNFDDYTVASAQLYKNKNAWYTSNPKPGDQIFFKNDKRICHTGIVYQVKDGKVYTVEGNTSAGSDIIANGGSVCKKSYDLSNNRIAGYGRPKYDSDEVSYTVGWNSDNKGWWYADKTDHYLADGWHVINHHWYYFKDDGYIATGVLKINGEIFYLMESGDLEGSCTKTDELGRLVEWYVD